MAMFPDSGVPPADAKNSLPDVDTLNCDELWYSTSRCQPRFDPPAANAMLAEQMNLIMKGELQYDCIRLDHVERAVRYINQRGMPRGCLFAGGPINYTTKLDPKATRYNDYMTLTIIPNVNNQSAVLLNLDELGDRNILRNDGQPLQAADLKAYKPEIIAYWSGNWYVVGLVASQVPIIASGALNTWIRTDGNDDTGDGTANSADKAFRTINGALRKVGGRFAVSANFSIVLRLGIPGTYESGDLGGSPNTIRLLGDINNPAAYVIDSEVRNGQGCNLWCYRSKEIYIEGVTLLLNRDPMYCVTGSSSIIFLHDVNFRQTVNAPGSAYWFAFGGAMYAYGNINLIGAGTLRCAFHHQGSSTFSDAGNVRRYNMTVTNNTFSQGFLIASDLSTITCGPLPFNSSGIVGPQFSITSNSILRTGGLTIPGSTAGSFSTGGQII